LSNSLLHLLGGCTGTKVFSVCPLKIRVLFII
jgi:hypothetical protein